MTEKDILFDIPVYTITGKGDSTWQNSTGTTLITRFEVPYRGQRQAVTADGFKGPERVAKGYKFVQHVSVNVLGPKPLPFWYTDTGAVEQVRAAFTRELLKQLGADDLTMTWSEQGMQGNGFWNFDVNLFWK